MVDTYEAPVRSFIFALAASLLPTATWCSGLQDYFAARPDQICGLHTPEFHFIQDAVGGAPLRKYTLPHALVCKHATFNLVPQIKVPDNLDPAAQLLKLAFEKRTFPLYPPYDAGEAIKKCSPPPPPPPAPPPAAFSVECAEALRKVDRPALMKLERYRAAEVLDTYLGNVDPGTDAKAKQQIEFVLQALQAATYVSPKELVDRLDLSAEMSKAPPVARLVDVPTWRMSTDSVQDLSFSTGKMFIRQLTAAVKLSINHGAGLAFVGVKTGHVDLAANPQMQSSHIDWLGAGWCDNNGPNGFPRPISPRVYLIYHLDEEVNKNTSFNFDGLSAELPLPPSDPNLKSSWLCLSSEQIINGQIGQIFAHPTEAADKGCKKCWPDS